MEPWAQELADSVDMTKVQVVDASSGVSMMKEEDEEHEHADSEESSAHEDENSHDHAGHHHEHTYDPHIWLDMQNAVQMVRNIEVLSAKQIRSIRKFISQCRSLYRDAECIEAELKEIVSEAASRDIVFGGRFA